MATYRDPVRVFAPLEVIERLIEIRGDAGFLPCIYLHTSDDIKTYLDAYGFDIFAFSNGDNFDFGHYRAPFVPGGDVAHSSLTAH